MNTYDETYSNQELMVSEETKEQRLKECMSCEFHKSPVCSKCDCIVGIMVSYTFKQCPESRW